MNRLLKPAFQEKKKRFVPYIMSGDPTLYISVDIAFQLQEAGADAIEWGIPFSDPLADGPVTQDAGQRSRKAGNTIMKAIDAIKEARKNGLTVPIVLFTYINPVLYFGEEAVIEKMKDADIDGLLIPDLPVEESEQIRLLCREQGISLISLITLSSASRIEKISRQSEGFIYFVSSLGVTGTRESFSKDLAHSIEMVKDVTNVPVLIGFGVSKKEHVLYFNEISDGVIVGSALVKQIGARAKALQSADPQEKQTALKEIKQFVTDLISS